MNPLFYPHPYPQSFSCTFTSGEGFLGDGHHVGRD